MAQYVREFFDKPSAFKCPWSLDQYYFKQPYWEKEPWRETVAFVSPRSLSGDMIIFPVSNEQLAFDYYYRVCEPQLERHGLIRDVDFSKNQGFIFSFDTPKEDLIAQFERLIQKTSRIWVITARMTIGPKGTKGIGHIVVDYMNSNKKYSRVLHKHIGGRMHVFLYDIENSQGDRTL